MMKRPFLLRVLPPTSIPQSLLDAVSFTIDLERISAVTIGGKSDTTTRFRDIPVLVLHGTMDSAGSWSKLASTLRERGRTVVLPSFGERGTGSVAESLSDLEQLVTLVLQRIGARQLDIVGHSQGGLLAYLMVQNMVLGRGLPTQTIRRVVSVSGSTKGALWPRPFSVLGYHGAWLAATIGGSAMKDQLTLARSVAKREFQPPLAKYPADRLPDWISIVSAGDGIVSPASALSTDDYPGAKTLTTEEELGRSIMHWLQQRDPDVVKLIAEQLEESSDADS